MVRIAAICSAIALLSALTSSPARALEPDALLGSWKLVSFLRHDTESGEKSRPLGSHPNGYLIVRPHHCAFLAEGDGTAPDAALMAYSGSYTTDRDPRDPNGTMFTVEVEVAADAALVGTKRARYAWVSGNQLVLTSQPGPRASAMMFVRAK